MKKETAKKLIIPAVAAASLLTLGGTMSYFTDQEATVNKFTVGEVAIELHEDEWDKLTDTDGNDIPDVCENMVPTQTVTKDPSVKNVGKDNCYAYMKVTVPMKNVITVNKDGSRNAKADTELYSFTKKAGWTQLSRTVRTDKTAVDYVFYYDTEVKPQQQTTSLFDSVTFANIIEGQIDNTRLEMPVEAVAIQSLNVGNQSEAYQKYLTQNK